MIKQFISLFFLLTETFPSLGCVIRSKRICSYNIWQNIISGPRRNFDRKLFFLLLFSWKLRFNYIFLDTHTGFVFMYDNSKTTMCACMCAFGTLVSTLHYLFNVAQFLPYLVLLGIAIFCRRTYILTTYIISPNNIIINLYGLYCLP